jgi:putative membrane protein
VTPYIPYCGAAPAPGHLMWNTDPVLVACLLGLGALYGGYARLRAVEGWRQGCFWLGWLLLSLALLSPLCNLSVALFSARIAQHVVLTLLAAPLLVLGQVGRILFPFCEKLPVPPAVRSLVAGPHACWVGALVFAIAMWLWHEPALYDATFQSTLVYWTMHISMVGAAVLFWDAAFVSPGFLAGSLFSIFATMLQMTLLGAILTFARTPLFSVHALTTLPWGVSSSEDQQLGGLIMWVIGGAILAAWGIVALLLSVTEKDATDAFERDSVRARARVG